MKNKRILTVIGICTLGAALTFGGCGKEKQKASEAAPKAEPAVTEAQHQRLFQQQRQLQHRRRFL